MKKLKEVLKKQKNNKIEDCIDCSGNPPTKTRDTLNEFKNVKYCTICLRVVSFKKSSE